MTKVRIEWIYAPSLQGVAAVFGAQSLTVTGATTAVLSTAAPAFGSDPSGSPISAGLARVTVLSGAAVLAWGVNPVALEADGLRLEVGQGACLVIAEGQQVSVVEAADPPSGAAASASNSSVSPAFLVASGVI